MPHLDHDLLVHQVPELRRDRTRVSLQLQYGLSMGLQLYAMTHLVAGHTRPALEVEGVLLQRLRNQRDGMQVD